jgi:hypothetical protein
MEPDKEKKHHFLFYIFQKDQEKYKIKKEMVSRIQKLLCKAAGLFRKENT